METWQHGRRGGVRVGVGVGEVGAGGLQRARLCVFAHVCEHAAVHVCTLLMIK